MRHGQFVRIERIEANAQMKIHEYQAKAILAKYGVPVPQGEVVFNAADAKSVLEQGFAKKVFVEKRDIDVNTRLLKVAETQAAQEKAALPAQEAAAKSAATGDALVKVGAQHLSFGDNVKAVAALTQGIAKGNLAKGDPKSAQRIDEASMLLGIAHLRNNNKAEAAKAFRAVKNDPTMVRVAKLWLLNT